MIVLAAVGVTGLVAAAFLPRGLVPPTTTPSSLPDDTSGDPVT